MLDEKGEYIAKANSLWSLLDVTTGKPVMVNEDMRRGYGIDEKLDMDYAPARSPYRRVDSCWNLSW